MRVALLTYSTRPRGGVVHTLALAEALVEAGADVTVAAVGRSGDTDFFRPVDPRVRLRVVPLPDEPDEGVTGRVLRSIDALAATIDTSAFDVVHAQDCISANAVDRPIRTVHHIDNFTTPALVRCHERAIVEPPAHVCVSAAVADELRVGWSIEATVIPNGVDAARFATAARGGPRSPVEGPYLLTVGGIEPRKGTLDLLEAHALLRDRHPDLPLVIAGGETMFDYRDYRARFDARAAELGTEPVLLGPVDEDALPAIVAGASAFALCSTKEGFGLAAMEALAAGVPVVLRDLPVLREVFADAVLYGDDPRSLGDAIDRALSGGAPAPEAGRDLAFGHTWAAAAQAHLRLYERLAR